MKAPPRSNGGGLGRNRCLGPFGKGLSLAAASLYSVRTMTGSRKLGHSNAEILLIALLVGVCQGRSQNVENPRASVVDVARCQARLRSTTDPLLLEAKTALSSCVRMPFAPPPMG